MLHALGQIQILQNIKLVNDNHIRYVKQLSTQLFAYLMHSFVIF